MASEAKEEILNGNRGATGKRSEGSRKRGVARSDSPYLKVALIIPGNRAFEDEEAEGLVNGLNCVLPKSTC